MGFEFEIGNKFRIANILQRGIPVLLGVSVAAGIDKFKFEEITHLGTQDEALFIDYRYSISAGMVVGIGMFEVGCDVGYMRFGSYINTVIDDEEFLALLRGETTESVYVQPSIEFGGASWIALFGGTRIFLDFHNKTEFFLQARVRMGK